MRFTPLSIGIIVAMFIMVNFTLIKGKVKLFEVLPKKIAYIVVGIANMALIISLLTYLSRIA